MNTTTTRTVIQDIRRCPKGTVFFTHLSFSSTIKFTHRYFLQKLKSTVVMSLQLIDD